MKLQFVVDFLDFHWGVHHFPSFNVADSAICIGVGLYIVSSFCSPSHPLRPALDGEGPGAQVTPRPGASV
jgi:lipoprotein signal peptidase